MKLGLELKPYISSPAYCDFSLNRTTNMKKILHLLAKLFTSKPKTRSEKNRIGYSNGYGCCPNCRDNWMWKPHGSITYLQEGFGRHGLLICNECLSEPGHLSTTNILEDLQRNNWPKDKLELVKVAVENYKASHEDTEFHENCPATS